MATHAALRKVAPVLRRFSRLFAFRGLHGTTTKEIAKAAGISEPLLYQHFENKEAIYATLEIMCSQQTAYFKQVVRELGPGTDSLFAITYLLVRIISFSKEPGTASKPGACSGAEILLRLMGYSFLEDGRFALSLVENCIGAFFDQWHESYRRAQKDGCLTVDKVDAVPLWLAYETVIGAGLFVLPAQKLIAKMGNVEEGAKAATLFILRGIGVKESVLREELNWAELKKLYVKARAAAELP